MIIKSKQR